MSDETQSAGERDRPSKSQLKRDMLELQALGEELAALGEEQLLALSLPENLLDAIREYARTPTHGARRRQMQYIGKLMRGVDAEPLRAAIERARRGSAAEAHRLHETERWRTRLVESDEAVAEWAERHPGADLRKLRRLIQAARAAMPQAAGRRALRELFRFLRGQSETSVVGDGE